MFCILENKKVIKNDSFNDEKVAPINQLNMKKLYTHTYIHTCAYFNYYKSKTLWISELFVVEL